VPVTRWTGTRKSVGEERVRSRQGWTITRAPSRRWTVTVVAVILALLTLALALSGCGAATATQYQGSVTGLRVFAAASLTSAFTEMGKQYEAAHPDVKVAFDFAGSQDLVAQVQQGAPADVLATADTATMDKVTGSVETPQVFAGNRPAIAVAPGNPKHVNGVADLARCDLKVVLAAPDVPAGAYADEILRAQGVTVKPVSLEVTVKGVVTKVAAGEADAGIVYVTDISAAGGDVDAVDIPTAQNRIATYPIAVVKGGDHATEAQSFVDFVLSAEGQKIVQQFGFLPPAVAP
jgi:molybdate transport system substrate-binding protein